MPRIVNARVTRADGSQFEAKIANLTLASVFLITSEPLAFRQPLKIEFLGVSIDAEIAFAISNPRLGGVASFIARASVREVLVAHLEGVEALTISLAKTGEIEEVWGEPTAASAKSALAGAVPKSGASAAGARTTAVLPALPSMLPGVTPPADPLDPTPHLGAILNQPWSDPTAPHEMDPEVVASDEKHMPLGEESLDLETMEEMKLDPDTLVPKGEEADPTDEQIDCPTPQNMPVMLRQGGAPDLYGRPPLTPKKAPAPPPPPEKPKPKREDPTLPDTPLGSLGGAIPSVRSGPEKVAPPDPASRDAENDPRRR